MTSNKPEVLPGEGKKDRKGKESLFCPFIGFEDDPSTALAYPAKYNFCFHAKPVAPVNLAHQRDFCLSEKFTGCPVLQNEDLKALPKHIRGERISKIKPTNLLPILALSAVVLIGLAAAFLTGIIPIDGFSPPLSRPVFVTQPPSLPTVISPTQEEIPTPLPTTTLAPTPTSTMPVISTQAPRQLETPFGSSPQLVVHKVVEGEGFILLAENFNTTADAIKAINYDLPQSLWVNTILVIPINTDDVTGLPQFQVVEIRAEGMTLETYSQRMQVDLALLQKYNDLPDGYSLKLGEYLIVPMTD